MAIELGKFASSAVTFFMDDEQQNKDMKDLSDSECLDNDKQTKLLSHFLYISFYNLKLVSKDTDKFSKNKNLIYSYLQEIHSPPPNSVL